MQSKLVSDFTVYTIKYGFDFFLSFMLSNLVSVKSRNLRQEAEARGSKQAAEAADRRELTPLLRGTRTQTQKDIPSESRTHGRPLERNHFSRHHAVGGRGRKSAGAYKLPRLLAPLHSPFRVRKRDEDLAQARART